MIIVIVTIFDCKITTAEETGGVLGGTNNERDAQDRAENDAKRSAQGSAENRPQTELKPLLSSTTKDAESSV